MIWWIVGLGALILLGLAWWGWRILDQAQMEQMVSEWIEEFPGRCMICSYHRWGMTHGCIPPDMPCPPHECLEMRE